MHSFTQLLYSMAYANGPLQLIHGAYYWVNYLVDVAILIGAFYSGYKWFDRQAQKRQNKKDADFGRRVKEDVVNSLKDVLPGAVDDFLDDTLDDAVSESVRSTFGEMFKKIDAIFSQTHDNGGGSITDSQKRQERSIEEILDSLKTMHGDLGTMKADLRNTRGWLESTSDGVKELGKSFERHLGQHDEAERRDRVTS